MATTAITLCVAPLPHALAQTFGGQALLNPTGAGARGWEKGVRVATDRAGTWVAVWETSKWLGSARLGYARTVSAARSLDGGKTWQAPVVIHSNGGIDSGSSYLPELATDRAGTWLVVWGTRDPVADAGGTDWHILFSRSTDAGETWTSPVPVNPDVSSHYGLHYDPSIATDGRGTWVTVWTSTDDLGGTIGTDDDILVARSDDGGQTWSSPKVLNSNAFTDDGLDGDAAVTTDAAGRWVVTWVSSNGLGGSLDEDFDVHLARSDDGGRSWTAPEPLNTDAGVDYGRDQSADVATDGLGNWVAVWERNGPGVYGIRYAYSTDGAETWSPPEFLVDGSAAWGPRVATDGAGNWAAVWESTDDLEGTIGSDPDILLVRSNDGGRSWTGPVALNSMARTDSRTDRDPQIETDGAGRWLAVWGSPGILSFALSPISCSGVPETTCVEGFARGSLLITEAVPGKEKLIAKLLKGRSLGEIDFGDPLSPGGTAYGLCIYDGDDALVASLEVDRAGETCRGGDPCWRSTGRGYVFRDRAARSDGVSKLLLRGSQGRKSKAILLARNDTGKGRSSLPVGIADALAGHGSVTLQLVSSGADCLSLRLAHVLEDQAGVFKAK